MLAGGTLRSYQLGGLRFLLSLVNNRVNGILADEMGLGELFLAMAYVWRIFGIMPSMNHGVTLFPRSSRAAVYRLVCSFVCQLGAGKTIQTISLLATLAERKGVTGPHMILAPKACVRHCPCFLVSGGLIGLEAYSSPAVVWRHRLAAKCCRQTRCRRRLKVVYRCPCQVFHQSESHMQWQAAQRKTLSSMAGEFAKRDSPHGCCLYVVAGSAEQLGQRVC